MDWGQFKDPVSCMYLAGVVVASWSLTQEMAGSNPFTVKTTIFRCWNQRIQWYLGKTQLTIGFRLLLWAPCHFWKEQSSQMYLISSEAF